MKRKTEEAFGWGLRVDGPLPYLAYTFHTYKKEIQKKCFATYHRPVRVVILPLAEYRRLKRLEP